MANSYFKKSLITSVLFGASLMMASNAFSAETTVKHDLDGFDKIRLDEVGLQLSVNVGEGFDITVEGEEELVENLTFRVRGEKLVISKTGGRKVWDRDGGDSPMVTISMPSFTGLDLKGAVDGKIDGVDSDEVEFDIKGAGNLEVEGKCNWLIVDLKGAGNFEFEDLKCKEVDVELKGAGNIEVYASERVDAEIKGMGNIDVYGNPTNIKKDDGWFSNISIH